MKFSHDWFSHNIPNILSSLAKIDGSVEKMLEIGSHEGRSACWFLANVLPADGTLVCLDIWHPDDLHDTFQQNVQAVGKPSQRITAVKAPSYDSLAGLIAAGRRGWFDLVYVDGSHTAYDTLADMTMAWGLLRPGGLMLVDDYLWDQAPADCDRPKAAVDSFVRCFANQVDVLHQGWQVHLRKK